MDSSLALTSSNPPIKLPIKLSPPSFQTLKSSISSPINAAKVINRPKGLFIKALFITSIAAVIAPIPITTPLNKVLALVHQSITPLTTFNTVLPIARKLLTTAINTFISPLKIAVILPMLSVIFARRLIKVCVAILKNLVPTAAVMISIVCVSISRALLKARACSADSLILTPAAA